MRFLSIAVLFVCFVLPSAKASDSFSASDLNHLTQALHKSLSSSGPLWVPTTDDFKNTHAVVMGLSASEVLSLKLVTNLLMNLGKMLHRKGRERRGPSATERRLVAEILAKFAPFLSDKLRFIGIRKMTSLASTFERAQADWSLIADPWYTRMQEIMGSADSQALASTLRSLMVMESPPTERYMRAWYIAVANRMPSLNHLDLAHSIYALDMLGMTPDQEFLEQWFTRAEEIFESFSSQSALNSIAALLRMKIKIPASFIEAWVSHSRERLETLNARDFSETTLIYNMIGLELDESFRDRWLERFYALASRFSSVDLSTIASRIKELGFSPKERFWLAWLGRANQVKYHFSARSAAYAVIGLGSLDVLPHEPLLRLFERRILGSITKLDEGLFVKCLYSFVNMGATPSDGFMQAWVKRATNMSMEQIRGLSNNHFSALVRSFLFLDPSEFPGELQRVIVQRQQEILGNEKFKTRFIRTNKSVISVSQSLIFEEVKKRLAHPNEWALEAELADLWIRADMVYRDKVVVETDGMHHFIKRAGKWQQRPKDLWLDDKLQKRGFSVIRVPLDSFDATDTANLDQLATDVEAAARCGGSFAAQKSP